MSRGNFLINLIIKYCLRGNAELNGIFITVILFKLAPRPSADRRNVRLSGANPVSSA
jgi:hypothetical protein